MGRHFFKVKKRYLYLALKKPETSRSLTFNATNSGAAGAYIYWPGGLKDT
jgi:hypothetical protein